MTFDFFGNIKKLGNAALNRVREAMNKLFVQPQKTNVLKRGALITFAYQRWQHDPYPLLIVSDFIPGKRIRGVNLHYLTFPSIQEILTIPKNTGTFSYAGIVGKGQLTNAFRTYKWDSVRQIKVLDLDFVLNVMSIVRTFDPAEVEVIRNEVQRQIQRRVNPKAEITPEQVMGLIHTQPRTPVGPTQQVGPTPPGQNIPNIEM